MKRKMRRRVGGIVLASTMLISTIPATALAADESSVDLVDINPSSNDADTLVVTNVNEATTNNTLDAADVNGEPDTRDADSTNWIDEANTDWYTSNSEASEFTITSTAELAGLAKLVNGGNDFSKKTIKLGANIDLAGKEWTPIGGSNTGKTFAGTFDGRDHTISNLKITRGFGYQGDENKVNNQIGLFGACTSAAKLQNFTLHNVDVTGSLNVAAVLGGSGGAEAKITNVHVTGNVKVYGYWYVGGILGKGYSTVTDCSVEGDGTNTSYVKGYDETDGSGYVGGIVGFMGENNNATVDCTVKNITIRGAYNGVGGINGILHYGNTISGCTVENVVVWQTTDPEADGRIYAGAFAGTYLDNSGKNPPTLSNCEFTGELYSGVDKTDILEPTRYVGSLWYGSEPPVTVNITDCVIHIAVAEVDGITYPTLAEAIDAVRGTGTIKLIKDVTLPEAITIPAGKNITLDLNGHTLSYGSDPVTLVSLKLFTAAALDVTNDAMIIVNGGSLTIVDSSTEQTGKIVVNDPSTAAIAVKGEKATVTIEGGTIKTAGDKLITVSDEGTATLTGGKFEDSTGTEVLPDEAVASTDNSRIVAIFKYDDKIITQHATSGEAFELPENPSPKDGYKFEGWQDEEGNFYKVGNPVTITKRTTFTPIWNQISTGGGASHPEAGNTSSSSDRYQIDKPSNVENGSIKVSDSKAQKGDTVTITITPDEGYELDELVVYDEDGDEIDLKDKGDGKFTFEMPKGDVEIEVSFAAISDETPKADFVDVPADAWYAEAVQYVYENGMMSGTSETTFSPNLTTTRGMIVTILYRLENEPTVTGTTAFTDVAADQYYANAVAWAAQNGIVAGIDATTFAPNNAITREQMAAILYRYAQFKGYDVSAKADLSVYTDAASVGAYAVDAMAWANGAGLITGTSATTLTPAGNATRAQVATILMRFCENIAK